MLANATEKLEVVEREIKQRERVYPRLCEQGKMSIEFASRQIEVMRQIAEDYRPQAEREKLL